MGTIVVQDKMHVQACGHCYVHGIEKLTEFHRAAAPLSLADHFPRLSLKGSKQGDRAMTDIVVSPPLHLAGAHGQQRVGTVQCLNLGLLIHTQHHGSIRRAEVEPHDVAHFFNEQGVTGEFEGLGTVRLQSKGAPSIC